MTFSDYSDQVICCFQTFFSTILEWSFQPICTYPYILISNLNSAGVPTRRLQASPSMGYYFRFPLSINIIIVFLFFWRLSVDLVWSLNKLFIFFHPHCLSQQLSHFHPTDESGGYVSLSSSHSLLLYSTLLYSTLLYSTLVSVLYS